jgi:hypothetical protein
LKIKRGIWVSPDRIVEDEFLFSGEIVYDTDNKKGIAKVSVAGLRSFFCGVQITKVRFKASDEDEAMRVLRELLWDEMSNAECESITNLERKRFEEKYINEKDITTQEVS